MMAINNLNNLEDFVLSFGCCLFFCYLLLVEFFFQKGGQLFSLKKVKDFKKRVIEKLSCALALGGMFLGTIHRSQYQITKSSDPFLLGIFFKSHLFKVRGFGSTCA